MEKYLTISSGIVTECSKLNKSKLKKLFAWIVIVYSVVSIFLSQKTSKNNR